MTPAVWDIEPESRKAERGKKLSASANNVNLRLAKEAAKRAYLRLERPISSDDVRDEAPDLFAYTAGEGRRNWMGSCFDGEEWVAVGYAKSRALDSHGRVVRTWALRA